MITQSDDGQDFGPDDPLLVLLPTLDYLGAPPGRYEKIRRGAARRRLLRVAAGVGLCGAAAALVALPLHLAGGASPASPAAPPEPPASSPSPRPTAPQAPAPAATRPTARTGGDVPPTATGAPGDVPPMATGAGTVTRGKVSSPTTITGAVPDATARPRVPTPTSDAPG